ncbi:MAG TPA: hypothetical protein VGO04_08425 [Ensifer sp.]|jgi:TolB-like protein|uniref:hypothetical protein n=1 Tax=Ensifer sp. TaxID=1872086 RepID=UPI002E10857B|nr:hypothetical protein [Ensifer sp.]
MAIRDPKDIGVEPTTSPLSNAEILTQLDRIRLSAEFDAPERDRKFLAYVIEETLAGRGDRIKAYSIATEVFGRDSSFDPQTDPAVRIEAGRIRRALERYYLVAGRNDPIVIRMPKGAYVPTFERRGDLRALTGAASVAVPEPSPFVHRFRRPIVLAASVFACALGGLAATVFLFPTESEPAAGIGRPNIPRLLVSPFEDLSGTQQSAMMARGLTDEVVGNIAKFKELDLVARSGSEDVLQASEEPTYALEGRVRVEGERLRLVVRLVRRSDGSVTWANTYDERLQSKDRIDEQAEIAAAVASAVAQPGGAVVQASAAQLKQSVPDEWKAYACTLTYYDHRGDFDPQSHRSVQQCLQQVTRQFPAYATAWALLSMTYVDTFRYQLDPAASPDALKQAGEASARALELAPLDVRALEARMLVFFFRGEIDAALATGARALAINPNDAELAGEYGLRLALAGQWDAGCKLLSESAERNLGRAGYFEAALANCAYFRDDYTAAERWARLADLRANPAYHVLLLATLGKLGKMAQAREERTWLETNAPGFLDNIGKEAALRLRRPEDQHHLLDGLRAAGVPVPDAEYQQARTGSPIR